MHKGRACQGPQLLPSGCSDILSVGLGCSPHLPPSQQEKEEGTRGRGQLPRAWGLPRVSGEMCQPLGWGWSTASAILSSGTC